MCGGGGDLGQKFDFYGRVLVHKNSVWWYIYRHRTSPECRKYTQATCRRRAEVIHVKWRFFRKKLEMLAPHGEPAAPSAATCVFSSSERAQGPQATAKQRAQTGRERRRRWDGELLIGSGGSRGMSRLNVRMHLQDMTSDLATTRLKRSLENPSDPGR
jgi:hypothetical protein